MLTYRPGSSSSCLTLPVVDGDSGVASSHTSDRYICLENIAAASDHYHADSDTDKSEDGASEASTSACGRLQSASASRTNNLKRSASVEDDLLEDGAIKRIRLSNGSHTSQTSQFKRIMTLTLQLQPTHSTKSKKKMAIDPAIYPDTLSVDISAFPLIKCGNSELAQLCGRKTQSRFNTATYQDEEHVLPSVLLLLKQTQGIKLESNGLRKVFGKVAGCEQPVPGVKHLDFHYVLDLDILLSPQGLQHRIYQQPSASLPKNLSLAQINLLSHAFIKHHDSRETLNSVENRTNTKYKETNIQWFYSCLPRPPKSGSYQKQDLKGKGKAREEDLDIDEASGSRPLLPSGLVPTLRPFQCRTLEWMLSREGKTAAGHDDDGKLLIQNISDIEQRKALKRGTMFSKAVLEDGTEWWFSPVSCDISTTDPAENENENEDDIMEGSILAEEMGLGKTVEVLCLILLSQEPERNLLPSYDAEFLANDVQPSSLTLLVCPQAIIGQWQDEIQRHTPNLRVLRYLGMKASFPVETGREIEDTIKDYDIVLCDFDTLAADLDIAKKPRVHNTRGAKARGGRVSYRRSVLVGIEWLRVVLDEAQMCASTTSAISEMVSWVPRKHSWAVSGTPIKQTIKDLGGLLKFLRIQDVGYDTGLFQRLLKPELGVVFTNLISRIGVRTMKTQIQNELALPPQERYIVPVTFTPVEIFNYRTKYGEALTELQIAMDEAQLTSSWTMDRRLMSRWLNVLRQACFHAQAGVNDRQRARGGRRVGEEEAVVQTLDEVLFNLREKNIAELHADQRNAAAAKVKRAYRIMYDKEDCERFEKGIKLLTSAKRDLRLLAEDIYNELLLVFPEARATTPESRATSTASALPEAAGHPYMSIFRDTVRDILEKRDANDSSSRAKNVSRVIAALKLRLREVMFVMHGAVFFTGNGYFGMGDKPTEEDAAYAEAEAIRKRLLHSDEMEAQKEIIKMDHRLHEKRIKARDVMFSLPETDGGLQSSRVFEAIEKTSEKANEVAELMLKWRKVVIEMLQSSLTDEEISEKEYQNKAETQERLDIYIEFLGRAQSDWVQLITGTKSALTDNPTAGGGVNQVVEDVELRNGTSTSDALPEEPVSKRSKRKQQMNAKAKQAVIAAANPGMKLRNELEAERKAVVPSFIFKPSTKTSRVAREVLSSDESDDEDDIPEGANLREQMRELGRLRDRIVNQTELAIVVQESSRLRKELASKDKLIDHLRSEQNLFADVYNARVKFYRVMQDFGDSVAELETAAATPYALQRDIAEFRRQEVDTERGLVAKIARRRFLDSLKEAKAAEQDCLICGDAYTADKEVIMTHCGHTMHKNCLQTWHTRSGMRTCPVCRADLVRNFAWQRVHWEGPSAKKLEPHKAKGITEDVLAKLPDTVDEGSSQLENDDATEETYDPNKQLNFLTPEVLDEISSMPLGGLQLGSKLDMIVKHVKYLREKHQRAIEEYETMMDQDDRQKNPLPTPPTEAKILIYSGWQYACDILSQAFKREKIGYVRLEGQDKKHKANAVIKFREDPDVAVFILHAQSQAAGLTLTAAQYVILSEPLMETALEIQAIARVHRIGQKQKTTVFQYVVTETVDERIALLSLRKRNHVIFSRTHSTGDIEESSVALTAAGEGDQQSSPRRKRLLQKGQEGKEKGIAVDADTLSDDDIARLLLDKDGMRSLQRVVLKVAKLKAEAAKALEEQRTARNRLVEEIMGAENSDAEAGAMSVDWQGWDLGMDRDEWMQA